MRRGRTAQFRTPWGDPDLEGIWDTDALRSVPLERDPEYGERAVLTDEELAARAAREQLRAVDDPSVRPDNPRENLRTPVHWDEWSDDPSARTSLIVDPPDGRIPPLTLGAQLRPEDPSTTIGFAGGSFGPGPFNGPEDYNPIDRCITRGLPNTWFPSIYNNGFQIVQNRDYVAILYERLHEHRIIPLDGRAPLDPGIRTWFGDSRGRWEGGHAGRRGDELQRPDQLPGRRLHAATARTLQPRGRRHGAHRDHRGRPGDLDAALDGGHRGARATPPTGRSSSTPATRRTTT